MVTPVAWHCRSEAIPSKEICPGGNVDAMHTFFGAAVHADHAPWQALFHTTEHCARHSFPPFSPSFPRPKRRYLICRGSLALMALAPPAALSNHHCADGEPFFDNPLWQPSLGPPRMSTTMVATLQKCLLPLLHSAQAASPWDQKLWEPTAIPFDERDRHLALMRSGTKVWVKVG